MKSETQLHMTSIMHKHIVISQYIESFKVSSEFRIVSVNIQGFGLLPLDRCSSWHQQVLGRSW
jgi:hypothetical protein